MVEPEGPHTPPIPQGAQDPPASPAPKAPQVLQAPQKPTPHMPPLNWSHFKPKFFDKDVEAHLLRTNNWMNTHRFQEDDKDFV